MAILSIAVSVAFLVYLLLRISRMTGGSTAQVVGGQTTAPPELPDRSPAEITELLNKCPTKWVEYAGTTPPLKLKIRGVSHELYRRFSRAQIEAFGKQTFDMLPMAQRVKTIEKLHPIVNAQALVIDWDGARYPNGNPIPFSPEAVAIFFRRDELLMNFVSEEAAKLNAW